MVKFSYIIVNNKDIFNCILDYNNKVGGFIFIDDKYPINQNAL